MSIGSQICSYCRGTLGEEYKGITAENVERLLVELWGVTDSLIWNRDYIKKQSIKKYYHEELENCLSLNHMLLGRSLKLFDPDQGGNENIPSKNLHNIMNHFWDTWKNEWLIWERERAREFWWRIITGRWSVREMLCWLKKVPIFSWRMALVEKLIYGTDGTARRVFKTCRETWRLAKKLCPIGNIENRKKEMMLVKLFRGWSSPDLTAVTAFGSEKTGAQKNIFLWKTKLYLSQKDPYLHQS